MRGTTGKQGVVGRLDRSSLPTDEPHEMTLSSFCAAKSHPPFFHLHFVFQRKKKPVLPVCVKNISHG